MKNTEEIYEKALLSKKNKKIASVIYLVVFLLISLVLGYVIGVPIVKNIKEPEQFRNWVDGYGTYGWIACIILMVVQIIIAIIPGGAVEVGAGYAFGTVKGTLICMAGSVIGSVIVFLFSRRFGVRIVEALFSLEKIRNLKFLHEERKRNILAFIVFTIPGTPKDLLSYFMGLTEMQLSTWIVISTVARIPAIVISTMSGDAVGSENYLGAILLMIILGGGTIMGSIIYKKICKENNKKHHT